MNIIGNKKALFSMHGTIIDHNKCINAIEKLSGIQEINIDELNNISETGGLYVSSNGTILDNFDDICEKRAKYKILPTGLMFRYSNYPLFISFIKIKSQWEGCFIGTGAMLFDMYKSHYKGKFNKEYEKYFTGSNRTANIIGFGKDSLNNTIKKNDEDLIYSSDTTDNVSNQLEVAINKIKNNIESDVVCTSKTKHKNKAQRKAERLQKHLEKIKEKEEKQKILDDELRKKEEEQRILEYEESKKEYGIIWVDVIDIEDVHIYFEDNETILLNKRIEDYINSDCNCNFSVNMAEDIDCNFNTKNNNEQEQEQEKQEQEQEQQEQEQQEQEQQEQEPNNIDAYSVIKYTEEDIIKSLDHDYNETTESDKYRMLIKMDIINDIYDRLLIKEQWKYNSKNRLGFYLMGICLYVYKHIEKNNKQIIGNGYTLSNNRKTCVINTGLIDVYGNFIYLIDSSPNVPDFYSKIISLMNNKTTLLKLDFDIENVKRLPKPINFIEDKSELIFDADYEDFDLDDSSHLYHIIEQRINRFPDNCLNETKMSICEKIKSAIRQACLISKASYNYVIPKYDFFREKIQFLIPLYINNGLDESPELTIVVDKQPDGIWNIYTVLYSDDAYDDARLLNRASDTWLNMKKVGDTQCKTTKNQKKK